jgi:GNAT superfamily N-acetyltransferase
MSVALSSTVTPVIEALWSESLDGIEDARGAVELMAQISNGLSSSELLKLSVANGELWLEESGAGFALCRDSVIFGIYVRPANRRNGIAKQMITEMISRAGAVDGFALPGDRATKSLYESIGWKARLLTMRGD